MIQANGESLSTPNQPRKKGNYTGERLKMLRPEIYRRVVELLAEPREHVSYREICRRCHVTDDTVKAVEKREAIPIAARKQALMVQAARIAKLAYDRVEDQIDSAPLPQAVDVLPMVQSQRDADGQLRSVGPAQGAAAGSVARLLHPDVVDTAAAGCGLVHLLQDSGF